MSRNLRLSSEVDLMAIMQRMRSPRSEMRDAESAHRTNHCSRVAGVAPSNVRARPKADAANGRQPTDGADAASRAPIYPLVGLCRAAGLPEPVPEYRWHPVRKFRADYALVLERVLIEYDGGLFINGGHSRGKARLYDMAKDRAATLLGWRVLRYGVGEMAQTVADLRILLAGWK